MIPRIGRIFFSCIAVAVGAAGAHAQSAMVDFETVAPGTTFGVLDGHSPGDVVLSQDGVDMRVENFVFGGSSEFGLAEIGGSFQDAFPTNELSIDNINLVFDFAGVGFPVTKVSLDYVQFGGLNNLAVNGGTVGSVALCESARRPVALVRRTPGDQVPPVAESGGRGQALVTRGDCVDAKLATHNLELSRRMDRVLRLEEGRVS